MAIKTFTTGEVLTASDTNTYLANAGLVYINEFTASGSSRALVCDNIFSSTYDYYKIVASLGSTSSTNYLYFQGISTGGSTVTSGYGSTCYTRDYFTVTTGVTAFGSLSNTVANLGPVANAVGNSSSIEFNLLNPRTTGVWWRGNGQMTGIYSGVAYAAGELYFSNNSSTQIRGIRIDNNAGSNLTGKVIVYGYRQA